MSDTPHDQPKLGSGCGPKTLAELYDLYRERYKFVHGALQTFNEMPVELLFEISAAWDHLSRHFATQQDAPLDQCVNRAAGHVKRAILDGNKLLLKQVVDEYGDLQSVDTSLIATGEFDRDMRCLMYDIRIAAIDARIKEGDTAGPSGWYGSFEVWDTVFAKCQKFREEFSLNPKVDWARRKTAEFTWKRRLEGFCVGLLASGVIAFFVWLLSG